jgi:oligopeptide transport system ATP-binding protein
MKEDRLLEVKNLSISFHTYAGEVQAVRDVSFHLNSGEVLAIVGESGSGKSAATQAIVGLTPIPPGEIKSAKIMFDGKDLSKCSLMELEHIRGKKITSIFQDPFTSLNPTMTIGNQIREVLHRHNKMTRKESYEKVIELLKITGIPDPCSRFKQYPYQLSGGMCQRAMISMAMANNPEILIADEPTTALDVTIQAQIFSLFKNLRNQFKTSIILITHDLGVVAGIADRVVVLYGGKVVEEGLVDQVYYNPHHPYTVGLLKAMPSLAHDGERKLRMIKGTPPLLINVSKGCSFAKRCDFAMKICTIESPDIYSIDQCKVSCWLYHKQSREQLAWFQNRKDAEE